MTANKAEGYKNKVSFQIHSPDHLDRDYLDKITLKYIYIYKMLKYSVFSWSLNIFIF